MQDPNRQHAVWQVCHSSVVGLKRSLKRSALARGAVGVQMRPASVSVAGEKLALVVDVDLCCCLCCCYWCRLWPRLMLVKSDSSDVAPAIVASDCVGDAGAIVASITALIS